jgi:hypothetical protein
MHLPANIFLLQHYERSCYFHSSMTGVPSMILSQSKAPSSPVRSSSHKKFGDEKHLREAQKWAVDLTAQQIKLRMQKIYRKQDHKKKDRTPNQFQQQITTINKYLTSFSQKLKSCSSSSFSSS